MSEARQQIIDGLKQASESRLAVATIDGVQWVRRSAADVRHEIEQDAKIEAALDIIRDDYRSQTHWAVKNDCNGIFEVYCRRDLALKALASIEYSAAGCYVVPVLVAEEQDDDARYAAHWDANQREDQKYSGSEPEFVAPEDPT